MESSHQDADQKVFQLANQEAWKSDLKLTNHLYGFLIEYQAIKGLYI